MSVAAMAVMMVTMRLRTVDEWATSSASWWLVLVPVGTILAYQRP